MSKFKKIMSIITMFILIVSLSNTVSLAYESNSFETAVQIAPGQIVDGEIVSPGDANYYKFTVNSSGSYVIYSIGDTNTYGSLYGSNKKRITSDNDRAGNRQFEIFTKLAQGQTYYIKVTCSDSNTGIGQYKIQVAAPFSSGILNENADGDDYGNNINLAKKIAPGEVIGGNLEYSGDRDYFRVIPNFSGKYIIYSAPTVDNIVDTYGVIYDSNWKRLASDNNGAGNNQFQIVKNLSAGQTYYICVSHNSSTGIGPYQLQVAAPDKSGYTNSPIEGDDYGNNMNLSAMLPVGVIKDGNIEMPGDVDYFKIVVDSNAKYDIISIGNNDMYGILYDNVGNRLKSDNNSNGNSQFKITTTLYTGKTYYLKVSHNSSGGTGDYSIKVIRK